MARHIKLLRDTADHRGDMRLLSIITLGLVGSACFVEATLPPDFDREARERTEAQDPPPPQGDPATEGEVEDPGGPDPVEDEGDVLEPGRTPGIEDDPEDDDDSEPPSERCLSERCNGLDDDCDGDTDEGFDVGEACALGIGACRNLGHMVCRGDGEGTLCSALAGRPQPETCDGLDNDCDGRTDEDFDSCDIDGACVLAGQRSADGCAVCLPDVASDSWTRLCEATLELDEFAEFALGALRGAGADVQMLADGGLAPLRALDVDNDGWPDLPSCAYREPDFATTSPIYLGGPDGIDAGRRIDVPTTGCFAVAIADVDSDGWPEIAYANHTDGLTYDSAVTLYRGGPAGPVLDEPIRIPASGPVDMAVADLNRDGWPDIVVANERTDNQMRIDTNVFYGGPGGEGARPPESLPARGPRDLEIADLDGDGWLDVVLAQFNDGAFVPQSAVYYGGPDGFEGHAPQVLFTGGAHGATVADLNRDGFLDLAFAEHFHGGFAQRSTIYWGSARGLDIGRSTKVRANASMGVSVADVDGDGALDLLHTGAWDDDPVADSILHWGPLSPLDEEGAGAQLALETIAGAGNLIHDFDLDGHTDLALYSGDAGMNLRVFSGGARGIGGRAPADHGVGRSYNGLTRDPGSIHDRREAYRYDTAVWDAGIALGRGRLAWQAETGEHTRIVAQVRSAVNEGDVESASWRGPDGSPNAWYDTPDTLLPAAHASHRFFQIRVELRRDRSVPGPTLRSLRLDVAQ